MDIPQEKLKDLAMAMLDCHKSDAVVGKYIFGVWKDEAHLKVWTNAENGEGEPCKILTGESEKMPQLPIDNKDKVIIAGICLAQKLDFSDLKLSFYLVVAPAKSSE